VARDGRVARQRKNDAGGSARFARWRGGGVVPRGRCPFERVVGSLQLYRPSSLDCLQFLADRPAAVRRYHQPRDAHSVLRDPLTCRPRLLTSSAPGRFIVDKIVTKPVRLQLRRQVPFVGGDIYIIIVGWVELGVYRALTAGREQFDGGIQRSRHEPVDHRR